MTVTPATSARAAVASSGVAAGAAGWGGPKGNSVWAGIAGAGRPVTEPGSGRLGPPALGAGLDGAGAGPGGVTRSRSLNLWLRSPEPGIGEPAASPSTMAARWSRASRSVVMMSESTASEPARIFSRTASMPCVNRAIGSRPTIAAAPLMLWAARKVLSRCARSPWRLSRSISPSSKLIRSSRASSKNSSRKRSSELPKTFTSQRIRSELKPVTCAGDKPPKPFPARFLCRSDWSSPARSKSLREFGKTRNRPACCWRDGESVLNKLRVHHDFVAPFFPPLRRGGRGGGHGTIFAVKELVHGLSP